MSITSCAITFYLIIGIGFGETKTLQQHTMQWEHQEMLFAKLINSTPPYNARLRPFATKTTEAKVNTSIYLYSMFSIDEMRADYTMQILYRETWYDERLRFIPDQTVQKIVGDNWHAEQIWTPSVHVVNDRDVGTLGKDTGRKVLLHIDPDGKVLLSKRVKLRPFCKMEFYRYPMDKQQCTLEIESSILPISDMILTWDQQKPVDLNRNFLIPGFILTNYSLEERVRSYQETGNFSRITVRFDLQREFGHFVLDIYIPSILFVVTSWLSFWVEIPAAPARVTLGMTTMLTLVTSEKAIREKLPKVSYVHALDIWNVVCTGFVFASLVEYALVNYIYHKDKRRRKNKGMKRAESTATFSSIDSDGGSNSRIYIKKEGASRDTKSGEYLDPGMPYKKAASFTSLSDMQSVNHLDINCGWPLDHLKLTPQDIANGIDRKCRYIFPIGFMIFNVIYWLVLWL